MNSVYIEEQLTMPVEIKWSCGIGANLRTNVPKLKKTSWIIFKSITDCHICQNVWFSIRRQQFYNHWVWSWNISGPKKLLCLDDGMNATSTAISPGRRRRHINDNKIKTKFAFAKLYVFDNKDIYFMENKSVKKAGNTSLWIIMCVCVFLSIESI